MGKSDLDRALDLIEEMLGLDKGPYEEEYVEWDERARKFWLEMRGKV